LAQPLLTGILIEPPVTYSIGYFPLMRMNTKLMPTVSSLFSVVAALGVLLGCSDRTPSEKSPASIDALLGKDQTARQETVDRKYKAFEENIALCMRGEGFEYDVYQVKQLNTLPPLPVEGEEETFYRKNGFGYLTGKAFVEPSPNSTRVANMPDGQRNAYLTALNGKTSGNMDAPGQPGGCFGNAMVFVSSQDQPFNNLREKLDQRIDNDIEVRNLQHKFISCMQKSGYRINNEDELYTKVLDPLLLETSQMGLSVEGDDPLVRSKIKATLTNAELKVAGVYSDCRPQADWDALRRVRKRYEKPFLEEYEKELKEAAQQASWR
jgi:hypothetical protein